MSSCARPNSSPQPLIENSARLRQTEPVKLIKRFFLCLALAAVATSFAGCQKTAPPAPDATAGEGQLTLPTHAQPKLPTIKIYLGAETLDAELALTPVEEMTGMMFRTNIQDTDSMLFDLHFPMQASFWMKNCPESISAAYITQDGMIAEIHHLEQNDTNPVYSATNNIRFVLETSEGWFTRHHVNPGTIVLTERGTLAATFSPR